MTATLDRDHPDACPVVGCSRRIKVGHLMCGPCWAQVPAALQREVYRTWKAFDRAIRHLDEDVRTYRAAYEAARDAAIASVA